MSIWDIYNHLSLTSSRVVWKYTNPFVTYTGKIKKILHWFNRHFLSNPKHSFGRQSRWLFHSSYRTTQTEPKYLQKSTVELKIKKKYQDLRTKNYHRHRKGWKTKGKRLFLFIKGKKWKRSRKIMNGGWYKGTWGKEKKQNKKNKWNKRNLYDT